MITKNVRLYLGDGFPVRIPVSQFDTMWQFVFEIIHNSQPWQIPTGATAVLNGRKPDGNVFAFSGIVTDNKVTVDCDVQMTAVAGQTVCELSILSDSKTIGTANFTLDVEAAPKSPDDVVSDTVLDGYGMMVTNAVDDYIERHPEVFGGDKFTQSAKNALLALLEKVTYIDEHGQSYLYALESALFPPASLVSIDAVFTQGENVITNQDTLDDLRQYLVVTANYDDETTETVSNYTLGGELTRGTCTITVGYGGKTDTFDVYVTYVDTSIVYSLATPATLSGSGYINSNYAAFGTDRDLTITVSIVNSRSNARARFFATNNSNVSVSGYLTGANAFRFDYFGGNNSVTFSSPDYSKRMNVVLAHTAGSGKIDGYISYYNTSGTLVTKSVSVTASSSPQTVANVVQFGGVSIANTQAINGTIYSAVIRTRVMDADEIQEFLTAEEV